MTFALLPIIMFQCVETFCMASLIISQQKNHTNHLYEKPSRRIKIPSMAYSKNKLTLILLKTSDKEGQFSI